MWLGEREKREKGSERRDEREGKGKWDPCVM